MEPEDAEMAVKSGADAIVVSNHGGRQLDGALSSIQALPNIVSAVGNEIEVWLDSGITSGQDMLKAWAMGARGFMTGKAFLHGLGRMGKLGYIVYWKFSIKKWMYLWRLLVIVT